MGVQATIFFWKKRNNVTSHENFVEKKIKMLQATKKLRKKIKKCYKPRKFCWKKKMLQATNFLWKKKMLQATIFLWKKILRKPK